MTILKQTLIIGAGHAGSEAAVSLRQGGYDGSIILIGNEAGLPYQRPPLSKAYLSGAVRIEDLPIRPAAAYEKAGIELRSETVATRIDITAKQIELGDGSRLPYSSLILATGSRARPLPLGGIGISLPQNLHYLRSRADADQLRGQMQPGRRLTIVGGGYIGLEVAAAAKHAGLTVTVLEAMPRLLARVTASEVSAFYEHEHRAAGIDLRLNGQLEHLKLDASGQRVEALVCADGNVIATDLVLVGIGGQPNTELAELAGMAVDNGILVDEFTRTSAPDVYAVGDCSNHPSAFYSRRLRLESIPNAIEQARAAAATINGRPQAYQSVPWFWSDQYDLKLQISGLNQGFDQVVIRGNPSLRSFTAFYLSQGRLIAADCINRQQEFMAVKKLVLSGYAGAAAALADESVSLKDFAALHT